MSQKNREGKRTARERLREEQQRQKTAQRRGRALKMGLACVLVLGVAAVAGVFLVNRGGGESTESRSSAKPISMGSASAASRLSIYEDFRCPACGQFENQFSDTIRELAKAGQLRTEYHLVTLIDSNMPGTGSKKAANAAYCAKDEGKFPEFHDVLYRNQPQEQDDAFGKTSTLLGLAKKVPGLSGSSFTSCVEEGRHNNTVEESDKAFGESGHQSTPTVLLDGEDIYGNQQEPLTPQRLKELVAGKN